MIKTEDLYGNASISNDDKELENIHLKSKNIAIYQRDIEPLSEVLHQLAEQAIECRASGTIQEIVSVLTEYFNHHLPQSSALLDDISEILALFQRTTQVSSFRLLLTTVSTNMCRKFHSDINYLRLLCTYLGPGTLWLPDAVADSLALQTGGKNHEIVIDEQLIQQVGTGDVVILKGALHPDGNPILHRSPTIEQHGERRLLLRIDTNSSLF